MTKKRKLGSSTKLDSLLVDNVKPETSNMPHESAFNSQKEIVRLLDVKLNYKNKRLVTQFIRIVPDNIIDEALAKGEDTKDYILKNIDRIPVNNIVANYRRIEDKQITGTNLTPVELDQLKYPKHYDKYDVDNEGVFVGKGICFHNISYKKQSFIEHFDDFVQAVQENGEALKNNDLVEDPQLLRSGSGYVLLFGHHRYCYLVNQYGTSHNYHFILCSNVKDQDQRIFRENNTSRNEVGYEKLLSYYFSAREALANAGIAENNIDKTLRSNSKIEHLGETMLASHYLIKTIPISKAYYYRLKPFLVDFKLIETISECDIKMSMNDFTSILNDIKNALRALGDDPEDIETLRSKFIIKMKSLSEIKESTSDSKEGEQKPTKKVAKLNVSLPTDSGVLKKLLFSDIREWSQTDVSQFDLTKKKGIKAYFAAVIDELEGTEQ